MNWTEGGPWPAHVNWSHADVVTPGLYQNPLVKEWKAKAPPSSLTPSPHPYLLMKRRYVRQWVQPVPEVGDRVRRWLRDTGLRPKGTWDEGGRRYIGVHVRRGDKVKSLGMKESADVAPFYIRTVLEALNTSTLHSLHPFALTSIQSRTPSSLTSACLEMGEEALLPQPDVVLVSDDHSVYETMPLLAPCWRWHFPFVGEGRGLGGHQQQRFDGMELEEREEVTLDFVCQLMALVLADEVVVTYSSNVGRLIATIRGWQDSQVEHRVHSLDYKWKEY